MFLPTARQKSPRIVPRLIRLNSHGTHIANSDHTGGGGKGVGSTQHGTTSLNGVKALPDHRHDRTRSHVLDKAREERFALQVLVVFIYPNQNGRDMAWLCRKCTNQTREVAKGDGLVFFFFFHYKI